MNTRTLAITVALLVGLVSGMRSAQAELIPPRGAVDARVRVVAYNPEDVVKLHGYVGYQIHIQWAEGEEFENLGSGDNAGINVGVWGNHFFLKPKEVQTRTNITVLTNRRVYHFDYTVTNPPPSRVAMKKMVYSLRFVYPQDEARKAAAELQRLRTEARFRAQGIGRKNTDYWFCGNKVLQPTSAYDNGVQTRLRFRARSEFPAIFVKNDDNSESLLNFNIDDDQDEVVIHRVARRLVLRRGQLVGCVVNRSFEGAAERLKSKTTVPGVDRMTKGVEP